MGIIRPSKLYLAGLAPPDQWRTLEKKGVGKKRTISPLGRRGLEYVGEVARQPAPLGWFGKERTAGGLGVS